MLSDKSSADNNNNNTDNNDIPIAQLATITPPQPQPTRKTDRYGFFLSSSNNNNTNKKQLILKDASRARKWLEMGILSPTLPDMNSGSFIQQIMQNNNNNIFPRIITTTSKNILHPKFISRIEKGIPNQIRGIAWKYLTTLAMIETRTPITTTMMTINSRPAAVQVNQPSLPPSDVAQTIENDVSRTFPSHVYFTTHIGRDSLRDILIRYALEDVEIGYCQGMSFLAGVLLMMMPEKSAYEVFTRLMSCPKYNFRELFRLGMHGLHLRNYQFEQAFPLVSKKLARHFKLLDINAGMFVTQWALCLFSYSFHFDFVLRAWDLFLFYGWPIFFGLTLAILKWDERLLLHCRLEDVFNRFKQYQMVNIVDVDRVIILGKSIARRITNQYQLEVWKKQWITNGSIL
jgi:hypothetical protein